MDYPNVYWAEIMFYLIASLYYRDGAPRFKGIALLSRLLPSLIPRKGSVPAGVITLL